ncbi:MAG: foldase [Candidatus Doudnabacteria bacterium]|nr:foldase [Candidatus Doudnabacteria bacterium]
MANTKEKKAHRKWIGRTAYTILALVVLFVIQAYLLPVKYVFGKKVLSFLPLPVAFVNADAVLLGNYYNRIDIATKISGVQDFQNGTLLDQLVNNKIVELSAKAKNLSVTSTDIEQSYTLLKQATGKQLLGADYAVSESDFKKQIILPDLLKIKLQIWLASNQKLNAAQYKTLDQAKKQLAAGDSFDVVASQYSDDALSAKIGGDLGYVSNTDLVPEIFNQLESIQDHNPHVIISRFGIHIVEVLDKDSKGPANSARYHVRQVFIKTTDYPKWFEKEKILYSVLKLKH